MCRLIDADELLETIEKNSYILCDAYNSKDKGMFITGIAQAVTEQSTVDIVRCKDCMKRSNLLCPMAKLDRHYNIINDADDDGFCSYGLEYEDTV